MASAGDTPPSGTVEGGEHGQEERVNHEDSNRVLTVLVALNGTDWRPVAGPNLTYFFPPPEPALEPDAADLKRGKAKKK